jgi:hypothetical protein
LANLDCIKEPNWAIQKVQYCIVCVLGCIGDQIQYTCLILPIGFPVFPIQYRYNALG